MILQDELPMVAVSSMNDTHLEETLLINKLEKAAKEGREEDVLKTLKELLEHTIIHFSKEEEMMEKTSFPAYPVHKSEHDRHINELHSIINYFEKNQDTQAILAYLEGNLKGWLLEHIKTMDTMTALYLQDALSNNK